MSPVVLSLLNSVERFHRFIFADPTSRAPFLYGLSLSPDLYYTANDGPRFADCLVAILEAAVHLEYLYFPTTIGLPICAAITKLTTLRELIMYSDAHSHPQHQPEAALNNLLAALRSPLQHLCVTDYERGQISAGILHDHLSHFAPTLECLTVEDFPFDIPLSSVTTPFTALRSLTINAAPFQSHFYRLDILLRLFPNLDGTLSLSRFMPPVDQYSALREQSKEAQRDYIWRGLDCVVYSAQLAFMLALRCPIRCMDIDGTVLQEAPYLTEALRDNCPSQLLLPLMFIGRDSLKILDGLFSPGAVNKLTHLVMFAEIKITERRWQSTGELDNLSWKEFMDSLIDSMKPLCRLTHLRLLLDHDIESIGRSVPKSVQPLAPFEDDFVHNIAHEADIYPAAIRPLDAMPTLQYLFLTTCGRRRYRGTWKYWHSSKAWCVVDADEETMTPSCPPDMEPCRPSCVEINGEEAQAVIDEEELYLRFREENMLRHCVENTLNL